MRIAEWGVLGLIVISVLISAFAYPSLPDTIPSHWNYRGEVDGYMGKFWGLGLMPIISVLLFLMYLAVPRVDPLRKNIEKFRGYFDGLIALIFLFLIYMQLIVVTWGLGIEANVIQLLSPAFGILFFFIGVMMGKTRRNWFIGIRTPWTLSSDRVWEKTHRIGGKLFKLSGLICFLGAALPEYAIWFIIVPVIASAIYAFVYSYFEFKKE